MTLNSLTVYLDPPEPRGSVLPFDGTIEYSRNESGREIVRLKIIPDPNDATVAGEQIKIRLKKSRRSRNEEILPAETDFTFTGPVPFDGQEFAFDLRQIHYSTDQPFTIMRRGGYFFDVEHIAGSGPLLPDTSSNEFLVSIMTSDRLEKEWLDGTTRRSNDDRNVRFQPSKVLGVKIIEISRNHPLDVFPLSYVRGGEPTPKSFLSWNDGEIVELDMSIPGGIQKQYILVDRFRSGYIIVQVDPRYLPPGDETERLLVDRELIQRESLRRWISEEADWLETDYLFVPIEPALCVSDYSLRNLTPSAGADPGPSMLPENFDYDIMGAPVTYYPPKEGHWINLEVPFGRPLHFEYFVGALENTRIIDVHPQWIHKSDGRQIQLVPFNQSLAYHFIGLVFVNSLRGPVELPSFWRYRYWAGIRDLETPMEIVEVVGLRAAVKALVVLGQKFRGGFSSQSVSRDGVSESASYTSSAMYGIYSATIEEYKKRLEEMLPQVKRKYFGIYLNVL